MVSRIRGIYKVLYSYVNNVYLVWDVERGNHYSSNRSIIHFMKEITNRVSSWSNVWRLSLKIISQLYLFRCYFAISSIDV